MSSRLSELLKLYIFSDKFSHVYSSVELLKYSLRHTELVFEMYAMLGKQYSTHLEAFQSTALCFEVVKHGVMFLNMQYPCWLEIVLNNRLI